jgi:hypothetical protein
MRPATYGAASRAPAPRAPLLVTGALILALPLVAIQGPFHTTPMDPINLLFIVGCWACVIVRREQVAFPLALPFWLIMVGSFAGLYGADDRIRAVLVIAQDVYLYLWFVTLAHFLSRRCRLDDVAIIWAAVACAVALLTYLDSRMGLLGGLFAGTTRATGTFDNPNMFGDYLVVSFFLTWAAAAGGRRLLYLALPVLLGGTLATHSNGSLLSLVGGTGVVVATSPVLWRPRHLGPLLIAAAALVMVVGLWHDDLSQLALARFDGSRTEVGGAALKGAGERLPIWEDLAHDVVTTPTGVGPGNFRAEADGNYLSAHNEYLGQLVERSVIGLAGWCGILAGVLAMLGCLRAAEAAAVRLPLALRPLYGLAAAIALHALVCELSHFRHFWLVLAMVAAAAAQATARSISNPVPVVAPGRLLFEESA